MNRWSALAMLLAIAGALALRVPKLATRPLHNDEAVNAIKVTELWQHGHYAYDPDEYHGPVLHYATLPFLWLSGARNANELDDAILRLAPVAFGVGLILLLLLFRDGLGRQALAWAALFTAVSPAMVFYSRYFIHEMLLVFFTTLTLGAGWCYVQARSSRHVPSPQRREGWEGHELLEPQESQRRHHPLPSIPAPETAPDEPTPNPSQEGSGVRCVVPLLGGARGGFRGAVGDKSLRKSLPVQGRGKSDAGWALLTGTGLGLMFATKETFVITLAAMGLAGIATAWWTMGRRPGCSDLSAIWNGKHAALALGAAFVVWLLLFSSFFTNPAGWQDSVRTYLPWLKRAGGHSLHVHPWYFYLERLAWFHPVKGPVWSEGLILALAAVGAAVSLTGKKSSLQRFLALYTIILTALYSAISYKTPWCLLNFYLGMILLAGVGAASLVESCRVRSWRVVMVTLLFALTLQLSWQAFCASFGLRLRRESQNGHTRFVLSPDWRNPYVYAQTTPDLLNLVQRAEGIARVAPAGFETVVKIIAPENDYWPLPWYLRRFKHLGWYDKLPDDPFAPIMVVSSKLNARLDEKSDPKWIMAGISQLRPGNFFELYVELELWKKYVETLPRDRD